MKFSSRKEFGVKSSSAYCSSRINKWLDDVCQHMKQKHGN